MYFNAAEGSKKIVSSCQHYDNWSCVLLTGNVRLVVAEKKVFCLEINYRGSDGERLVLCDPSNKANLGLMCTITIVMILNFVVFTCGSQVSVVVPLPCRLPAR